MARGSEEKAQVIEQILSNFEGSFLYNGGKEVRIPVGEVQIKVSLTCAKDNVAPGEDQAIPGAKIVAKPGAEPAFIPATEEKVVAEPTKEEIDTMADFMAALNL